MESKSCAHIEEINLDFAEAHNKRYFIQADGVIDNDSKNINVTLLSDDYYIKREKEFFIKGGNGATKKVNFLGIDFDKVFDEIKQTYKENNGKDWKNRKGPGIGKEQIFKEMTVNTKSNTSLEDLKVLTKNLHKLGITVLELSLHNDEGHINENGEKEYNHHCHVIFANCDNEANYKRWQKKDYQKLQDIVATSLDMERGERGSKTKRLSSQQYKAVKKNETELLSREKQLKNIALNELEQYKNISNNQLAEIKELQNQINKLKNEKRIVVDRFNNASDKVQELTKKNNELEALFNALGLNEIKQTQDIKKIKQLLLESLAREYNEKREALKNSGVAKQQDYSELKKDNEEKKDVINKSFIISKNNKKEILPDL